MQLDFRSSVWGVVRRTFRMFFNVAGIAVKAILLTMSAMYAVQISPDFTALLIVVFIYALGFDIMQYSDHLFKRSK